METECLLFNLEVWSVDNFFPNFCTSTGCYFLKSSTTNSWCYGVVCNIWNCLSSLWSKQFDDVRLGHKVWFMLLIELVSLQQSRMRKYLSANNPHFQSAWPGPWVLLGSYHVQSGSLLHQCELYVSDNETGGCWFAPFFSFPLFEYIYAVVLKDFCKILEVFLHTLQTTDVLSIHDVG